MNGEGGSDICFTRFDGHILRTTILVFFRFGFSFALRELSSSHTQRALPDSSGDDNSDEAAITA